MMPQWALACLLNIAFLSLYVLAFFRYDAKPTGFVSNACTAAIMLSLVIAIAVLVRNILVAKTGEVAQAVNKGVVSGLNLTWAISCLSWLCFIGWTPVIEFAGNNLGMVASGIVAAVLVVAGYYFTAPGKSEKAAADAAVNAVALAPGFTPTLAQLPTFQVSIADLTRLLAHQAGRAIGYTGSNILFDDAFSLELDANERVARVYSNANLIHTEDFMYWRLHMLMMGSAAELVLTKSSSQAAVDDFTQFDELASKYLTLRPDRTFNTAPINEYEAQIKASRIAMLRKNVFDRCHAACVANQPVLLELVKLMRTRSVLTYGDIRSHLDRVSMPEGFPVAKFDDGEILMKGLLTHDDHQEVTLDGAFDHLGGADELAIAAASEMHQPAQSKHAADSEQTHGQSHANFHSITA
ncbi:hypothetical protein NPS53_09755 [Pseudomonas putida]|uniref:hypothetical protein n=1 Tax=Pseudomonas putida TaxID=303 RepID=UPI002363BFBA|nr:hypothetical protein [Pseudomonas putida]MDD2139863.1 hypothetical protein [Pseudomonas putida]HDS1721786.1 hypothetical protein [Pseudomonas putida]